jgi:non-ribosomal peptide synthase protein (TIGR01720 family)
LLPQAEQSMVIGSVPLVPIQHWFFEQNFVDPHHWNQAVLLQVQQTLDPDLLRRVLRQLLVHHDALRLRFVKGEMGWQQINAELGQDVPFECVDLTEVPSRECNRTINDVAAELHASLNLSDGPIVRAVLFDFGVNHTARLLIIIHHLAIDGVSWRVLLQDINSLYQHLKRGEGIRLLPKTTSFKEWATRLVTCVQSGALQSELDYWLTQLQKERYDLPLDKPGGINVVGSIQNVLVSLDERETRLLLQEVPQVYHTHINDVLLTALVQAFARWTGKPFLFLDLEGHGREMLFESVDLSRTVGWFTSMFPVRLDLGEDSFDPGEALKSVKEQLRRVPRQGISYGLLRYLSQDEKVVERLRALPRAQVSFNYLGQFDQLFEETALFKPAQEESSGPARSLRGKCSHLIEINSLVSDSQLQVVFNFSENLYGRNTIECLAQDFIAALRLLTTHCLSPEAGGYTLSDFPEADLNQAALERIMAQLDD